jgi:hypothetical protein
MGVKRGEGGKGRERTWTCTPALSILVEVMVLKSRALGPVRNWMPEAVVDTLVEHKLRVRERGRGVRTTLRGPGWRSWRGGGRRGMLRSVGWETLLVT